MGGSGGSTSGKVEYPDYIMKVHGAWIGASPTAQISWTVTDWVSGAASDPPNNNPYYDAAAGIIMPANPAEAYTPTADSPLYDIQKVADDLIDLDFTSNTDYYRGLLLATPDGTLMDPMSDFNDAASLAINTVAGHTATYSYIQVGSLGALADINLDAVTSPATIDVADVTVSSFSNQLDTAASAFYDSLDTITDDARAKFKAGMSDINAVHSSTFILGLALIDDAVVKETSKYSGDLRARAFMQERELEWKSKIDKRDLQTKQAIDRREKIWQASMQSQKLALEEDMDKRKLTFEGDLQTTLKQADISQGTQQIKMTREEFMGRFSYDLTKSILALKNQAVIEGNRTAFGMMTSTLEFWIKVAASMMESRRLAFTMRKEYQTEAVQNKVGYYKWKFDAVQTAANVMAAPHGAGVIPGSAHTGGFKSVLGGALSGVGAGMMAGSSFGPVGTAVGGGLGAILGMIGGS